LALERTGTLYPALALVAAAGVASDLPARRASALDPVEVLKAD
jgi:ABC-type lipoprotein release transport system permease subunit